MGASSDEISFYRLKTKKKRASLLTPMFIIQKT